MMLRVLIAVLQAPAWQVTPAVPTVGDTVWVERTIDVRPGWLVRPSPWELTGGPAETLGPAGIVEVAPGRMVVRYPLVFWEPGAHTVSPPVVWRIGPAGAADSAAAELLVVVVASLVPAADSTPRDPRAPLGRLVRAQAPVAAAGLLGMLLVAALWRWRRRAPRRARERRASGAAGRERRRGTGDRRVDVARVAWRLRRRLARRVPAAHGALTTDQCLEVLAAERPDWPLDRLRSALRRLDAARFAPLEAHDLTGLVEEVAAIEERL